MLKTTTNLASSEGIDNSAQFATDSAKNDKLDIRSTELESDIRIEVERSNVAKISECPAHQPSSFESAGILEKFYIRFNPLF